MNNQKKKMIYSIAIKFMIAIFAVIGLCKCMFSSGFMGGPTLMLYFTIQSNIWIAVVGIVFAVLQIRALKKGVFHLPQVCYLIQEIFTVSITLTGVVFCVVLVPAMGGLSMFSQYEQVFLHVVTPVLAVIDFIAFTRYKCFKKSQCLWAAIPPLYYLGFATVGYFLKWDFGGGNNFPYFFMNYGSPAGFFGFSNEMPYFMGSFYWIVVLVFFVIGVSLLYITIVNRRIKKQEIKVKLPETQNV